MTNSASKQLNQHLAVIMIFIWLLPLVSFVPQIFVPYTTQAFVINVLSLLVIVPLLSYVLMPLTCRLLNSFGQLKQDKR